MFEGWCSEDAAHYLCALQWQLHNNQIVTMQLPLQGALYFFSSIPRVPLLCNSALGYV